MKKHFVFALFGLISTPVFSQIQSANSWIFVGMGGSPIDSNQTRSYVSQGSQIFCNFGRTKFGNGNHVMQGTWVKYFLETYPVIPDTLKYNVKYLSGSNILRMNMGFAIQDSFSYHYSLRNTLSLDSGWQTMLWDMAEVKGFFQSGHFGKLYLVFEMIALDSCAIGSSIFVDNLRGVDSNGITTIYDYFGDPPAAVSETGEIPSGFTLGQNYPNPFNPSTTIKFSIFQRGYVNLSVFNLLGQEVRNLVTEVREQGTYEAVFNSSNLPSETYFYKLLVGASIEAKRMLLLK